MPAVRLATTEDIASCQAIDDALGQKRATPEPFQRALDGSRVVLAEDGGAVRAYLWWSWFWDKWPMATIARVHPDHQRSGHGRALYAAVEERFRTLGCKFWLSSTEEDNVRSIAFHEALGFRRIGALRELDQKVREVFLRKDLA